MKKRILAVLLSMVMAVQTGAVALAAEQTDIRKQTETVMAVEPQNVEMADGTEVYSASGEEHIFQQGAMGTAYYPADEEEALRGDYAWEAAFRERLAKAMENCETIVYIDDLKINSNTYGRDVFLDVYWDEINMNPQCFYISGYVSWSYDMAGNYYYVTLGYENKYVQEDGSLDKATLTADKQAYEKRVEEALSAVDDNMTDVEKLLVVHDFLVRECDYDYANYLADSIPKESYSVVGAMVNNTAVCNGYTLALIDMMNRLDIANYYVSSDAINHAWNLVYLDGNWYHVDATWDDPITTGNSDYIVEGRVRHNNFVLSDEEITETGHHGWDTNVPKATNNNSYEGYIFRSAAGAINYYDGLWYYQDSSNDVVASDILGTDPKILFDDTYYRYMHGIGDAMYLADTSGIYKLSAPNFDTKEKVRIFTEEAEYANSSLTEFTIKNRQFVAVLQDNNTDKDTRLVFDIEGLETKPDKYTVFFDSNGGSEITKITDVESGAVVAQPEDPVREGYKFLGWYKDVELTIPWNFATDAVTENIVLHAKWEIIPIEETGVELSAAQLVLEIGDVDVLIATILPEEATDKRLTWTSSNPGVAAVEDGVVTALSVGSTTITVTTANGKTATCTVTVVKEIVEVTEVTLAQTYVSLEEGSKVTLTATITPENATNQILTWSSSDTEVATVEDGMVTAVKPGYAVIYAKASNGVYGYCWVTVTEKVVEVTGVTLNYTSVTLKEGESIVINATLSPEGTTNSSTNWWNSDTHVVSYDVLDLYSVQLTALNVGTVTITFEAENGTKASCQVTVTKAEDDDQNGDITKPEIGDVDPNSWMWPFVKYAYDNDIMSGVGKDATGKAIFAPEGTLTREQFAQVIYNKEGTQKVTSDNPFSDVKEDWYTNAVIWVAENGIASGYEGGRFGVGDQITREQLAVMLYNYAKYKGYDVTGTADLEEMFPDADEVSDWADTALKWAVANRVMSGKIGMLDPKGKATRAECATMIYNFVNAFEQ